MTDYVSVDDNIAYHIDRENYFMDILFIDASIIYLFRPSRYVIEENTLLSILLDNASHEADTDAFDNYILSTTITGIFSNLENYHIEQMICEYIFNSYSVCYEDNIMEIINTYIDNIRDTLFKLINPYIEGYRNFNEINDDNYEMVYYANNLDSYVYRDKTRVRFKVYLLRRKGITYARK